MLGFQKEYESDEVMELKKEDWLEVSMALPLGYELVLMSVLSMVFGWELSLKALTMAF